MSAKEQSIHQEARQQNAALFEITDALDTFARKHSPVVLLLRYAARVKGDDPAIVDRYLSYSWYLAIFLSLPLRRRLVYLVAIPILLFLIAYAGPMVRF